MTTQLASEATTRPIWGLTLRDDGRIALSHGDQLVATAAYRALTERTRINIIYARLTSVACRPRHHHHSTP